MSVVNYYEKIKTQKTHNPGYEKNHLIKIPFRMLIAGGSGSGKTNTLMNVLSVMTETFHNVIICTMNMSEPLYDKLRNDHDSVIFHEGGFIPDINDLGKELKIVKQDPNEEEKEKLIKVGNDNTLIVFDDLVNSKKANTTIRDYYLRARKFNISCVYLSQSFYSVNKFIRQQLSHVILMNGLLPRDLDIILREFSLGIDKKQLSELYKQHCSKPLEFILIHLILDNKHGYRITNDFNKYIV